MIDERLSIIAYTSVILLIASIMSAMLSGLPLSAAIIWNVLLALDIEYFKIPLSSASSPLLVLSSVLDVIVFTLFAVWLAAMFFEFIKGLGLREKLEQRRISKFKGHVIITNMNKLGELVSKKLSEKNIRTVLIAQNPEELESAEELHTAAIMGNPTIKETLLKAGIRNAAYVIACSDNDIHNSMIAIAAKSVEGKVKVITRVSSEENIPKLSRSGVYKCIMPEAAAGSSMADSIIRAYS
ncbi:MAG: NAD-binding protein [Candidatus Marsarchaeota archaeon]|nr:NAD-binding protein [Candidatus Marsarchaeota archaeon]MCL5101792.1 NAD-binding protein [Candidatus Marsarchaeota archaeon]